MLSFTAAETVSTHCAEQRELALSWLSANWTGAGGGVLAKSFLIQWSEKSLIKSSLLPRPAAGRESMQVRSHLS